MQAGAAGVVGGDSGATHLVNPRRPLLTIGGLTGIHFPGSTRGNGWKERPP